MCSLRRDIRKILEELAHIHDHLIRLDSANVQDERRDRIIMTAVQIQQETLDGLATQVSDLIAVVDAIDLTVLPDADSSALIAGVSGLASAINSKAFPTTVPEPVPEPSPTPEPVATPDEPVEETLGE